MLSKLATARSACRQCSSSLHRRAPREVSARTALAHGSRSKACCTIRSTTVYSALPPSITHAARFFSTSSNFKTKHTQHASPRTPNPARSNQKPVHLQARQLEHESREFLKTYQTMDASHRGFNFQHLLMSWGQLINALSKQRNLLRPAAHCVDSLAHCFLDVSLESTVARPNNSITAAQLINPAIHGWAKVQSIDPNCDAATRAETLLKRLLHVFQQKEERYFQPHLTTYNMVLDAWSKSASPEAPDKAREWLEHMLSKNTSLSPDRISYNSVLNAYATRGDAAAAMELFTEMKQQPLRRLQPDKYSYSMAMKAWHRSGLPGAPRNALKLLEELKRTYSQNRKLNPHLRPENSIYGIAMSLASAQKAHSLLQDMLDWYHREQSPDMQPQARHFSLVMNAYAKEGKAEEAEQLFMKMLELHNSGYDHMHPDRQGFVVLISAWCRQRTPESIRRAQAILCRMEELFLDAGHSGESLNAYGYNAVMDAHVHSGEEGAADRVEEIFDRMNRLGQEHKNAEMLPDKASYTILMRAWIQERAPGFAERVQRLLTEMNESGRASLKPDVRCYACAINAWSKSGETEAGERAEALLRRMQSLYEEGDPDLEPNDFCFNSVINAYSKAGNAEQAESILKWMEDSYLGGNKNAKPDHVSYTSCIDAWTRNERVSVVAVQQARAIFARMLDKSRQGDKDCEPTASTFSSFMMVLAKSASPEVARVAKENLQVMQELGIRLNMVSYNALIHACSCASGDAAAKHEALELAITSFHMMRNSGIGVDSITYNSLLHLVNNLIPNLDERRGALEDVFRKCEEDEMVNGIVTASMKHFALHSSTESPIGDDESESASSQTKS